MARPRIFISSTYFDLKSIREELDRFVSTLGYEPVRHEMGHIAYGKDESPEAYAYREVEFCDILVSIVGSKYGSGSSDGEYSISQRELKQAIELGKQVYVFVDEAVLAEFKFYQSNKHLSDVKYTAVTDTRIYSFLEEVYGLPHGNPIFAFRTGGDLVRILRDQWAGLFQRLLTQEAVRGQTALLAQLQQSLQTVDQLVKFLQQSQANDTKALQDIVLTNHPIFTKLREKTRNRYRIYFATLEELSEWLINARTFRAGSIEDEFLSWVRQVPTIRLKGKTPAEPQYEVLRVAKSLFDGAGRLRPIGQGDWKDEWLTLERTSERPAAIDDDDIPF